MTFPGDNGSHSIHVTVNFRVPPFFVLPCWPLLLRSMDLSAIHRFNHRLTHQGPRLVTFPFLEDPTPANCGNFECTRRRRTSPRGPPLFPRSLPALLSFVGATRLGCDSGTKKPDNPSAYARSISQCRSRPVNDDADVMTARRSVGHPYPKPNPMPTDQEDWRRNSPINAPSRG